MVLIGTPSNRFESCWTRYPTIIPNQYRPSNPHSPSTTLLKHPPSILNAFLNKKGSARVSLLQKAEEGKYFTLSTLAIKD
ncbi:hypothetical protein LguiA_004623 [Lonicera macranthoides]